jgi:hypothetical protein
LRSVLVTENSQPQEKVIKHHTQKKEFRIMRMRNLPELI